MFSDEHHRRRERRNRPNVFKVDNGGGTVFVWLNQDRIDRFWLET